MEKKLARATSWRTRSACHAKDPECDLAGSEKSLKGGSVIVMGADPPSKNCSDSIRDMKNCGMKADFPLPLLSLLAHLTETISMSSRSRSQH